MNNENAKTITKLSENYINLEQSIIAQLDIEKDNRENIWLPVFRRIVPTKYNLETNVYIIDSHKIISPKVSIAIYDEQYTPYIFNYGSLKFIPIEAVFAVVLCEKESTNPHDWLECIQILKTDMNAYVRIQTKVLDTFKESQTQTATRPITILCTTNDTRQYEKFDIVLGVKKTDRLEKVIAKEDEQLTYWYKELNHFKNEEYVLDKTIVTERKLKDLNVYKNGKDGDLNVLLSLTFQLNQLLMLINNPMFFPHQSYVEAFREVLKGGGGSR
ncbi:DUF6602 domain-containing protein [Lysinibacillus sp. FSL H8-0500]|uniref:DUF6602 domain-containing protein n=1 Tax=Lysinibacillus sp. FSL H8-0500 TaxID=2921393 RepID=UPI003101018F